MPLRQAYYGVMAVSSAVLVMPWVTSWCHPRGLPQDSADSWLFGSAIVFWLVLLAIERACQAVGHGHSLAVPQMSH